MKERTYHIEIGIIGSNQVIRTMSMGLDKANARYENICRDINRSYGLFEICEDRSRIAIPEHAVAWARIVKDEEQAD